MTTKVLYSKGYILEELPSLVDFSVFLQLSPKQLTESWRAEKKFKKNIEGVQFMFTYGWRISQRILMRKTELMRRKLIRFFEQTWCEEGVKVNYTWIFSTSLNLDWREAIGFQSPTSKILGETAQMWRVIALAEIFMIMGNSTSEAKGDFYGEV